MTPEEINQLASELDNIQSLLTNEKLSLTIAMKDALENLSSSCNDLINEIDWKI